MRTQKTGVFFILFLFVGLTTINAGPVDARSFPLALHLEQAIELALKNNPALNAEKEKLRIDHGQHEQAQRLFQLNPELTIDANHLQSKISSPSGNTGTELELRLLQEVEISGQRKHRIDAALNYLKAAEWLVAETERQLRLKVSHLFYDLLTLQEKIKIQKQRLSIHENLFNAGQKRFQLKDISVLEIDTLRFDRDQAKHDLLKLKADALNGKKALLSSLGLNEGSKVTAIGLISKMPSQEREKRSSLEELENCALNERPDLKAAQAALEGDEAAVELALSRKVPNLSLGPLFKSDNEEEVIGASLVIPLPFFNRNQSEVVEARVNLDLKKIALEAKKMQVRQEVAVAYRKNQLAKERFDLYEPNYLESLEKRMTFPKRAYRSGEISIFEFSVAQTRLAEAQIRYLEALLFLLKAGADLEGQMGNCRLNSGSHSITPKP